MSWKAPPRPTEHTPPAARLDAMAGFGLFSPPQLSRKKGLKKKQKAQEKDHSLEHSLALRRACRKKRALRGQKLRVPEVFYFRCAMSTAGANHSQGLPKPCICLG